MQLQLKFQLILIYNKAANWTIEEISILVTTAIFVLLPLKLSYLSYLISQFTTERPSSVR
jgi:hypothetical protein